MRHSNLLLSVLAASCLIGCVPATEAKKDPVDFVNNRIGNISHLLVPTFPTSHQPNSMVRMNPGHNEFVTDRLEGLPLNVPSHRQGSVLFLMPYCGDPAGLRPRMAYRYDQEKTSPHKYSVFLDDFGILVEFAPGRKTGMFSCSFEQEGERILQLRATGEGEIQGEGNALYGFDLYSNDTKHYFYAEFDKTPVSFSSGDGAAVCGAAFGDEVEKVTMRYGVSYISVDQARRNLANELEDFDLEALSARARSSWNEVLGKIQVEGGTPDQKTTFYTALYRSHERMVEISEDGRYFSGFDRQVHDDGGIPFWTDDWVWDTYHALHPLQTILDPEAEEQKLASYIRMYEQSGWMPTFPTVFGDAHCMNGNHAAIIFADALAKGLDFDVEKAYEGIRRTILGETMIPWCRGEKTVLDDFYHQNGWFPALAPDEPETIPQVQSFEKRQAVAVTLAASYDDWAVSKLAEKLGKKEESDYHLRRAFNYRNLFNPESTFFHPKDDKGRFIEPFDYLFSGGVGCRDYYDEGNAWLYNWDVHHNISDLIALFGGERPFIDKLDRMFDSSLTRSKWQYYAVHPDATGNVGQFVMGNEPSFHVPYLYNYAGQPWKTQKRIRMLMESWFRNDLMGVCGDEDGGGMSAFYVFSAMGFYPVTAGMPYYVIGSPIFDKVSIELPGGKTFTLIAENNSPDNKYIQSASLDGRPYDKTYFSHEDILSGGTLTLVMGDRANKSWGVGPGSIPPSEGPGLDQPAR